MLTQATLYQRGTLPLLPMTQQTPQQMPKHDAGSRLPALATPLATDQPLARLVMSCCSSETRLLAPLVRWLRFYGLKTPSSAALALTSSLADADSVQVDALALLSPRGVWLYRHLHAAATSSLRDLATADELLAAFVHDRARFRKTYPQHLALALACAESSVDSPERTDCQSAITAVLATVSANAKGDAWSADLQFALQVALEQRQLSRLVAPSVLAEALYQPNGQLSLLHRHSIRRVIGAFEPHPDLARDSSADLDFAAKHDDPLSLDPSQLSALALACWLHQASDVAERYFVALALAKDALRAQHPSLDVFLQAMSNEAVARSLDQFLEGRSSGWFDQRLPGWLILGHGRLSEGFAERLIHDMSRQAGAALSPLAQAAVLRLDTTVVETLVHQHVGYASPVLRKLPAILRLRDEVEAMSERPS